MRTPDIRTVTKVFLHGRPQANKLAGELERNGNPAFRERIQPLHRIGVPVAIQREPEDGLETALQIAVREARLSDAPPAIIISANSTGLSLSGLRRARGNLEVIRDIASTHQDIPISHIKPTYPSNVPIGTVKDDLWAADISLLKELRSKMRDYPMTNWDADTFAATLYYLRDTERMYQLRASMGEAALLTAIWPIVNHGRLDDERFPRINELLELEDTVARELRGGLPAHHTVNLRAFVTGGGCRNVACGEHIRPLEQVKNIYGLPTATDGLRHTVTVSPRRLVGQMMLGQRPEYGSLATGFDDIARQEPVADIPEPFYDTEKARLTEEIARNRQASLARRSSQL